MASKVNLALSGLPRVHGGAEGDDGALRGRIHIGPDIDALERAFDDAKYGGISQPPVARRHDPDAHRSRRSRRRAST